MFDLQELKIRKKYAGELGDFVGIRRSHLSNQLEFCLPKGFDEFPTDNFDSLKRLFFKTYKTYRKYFEEKKNTANSTGIDGFSETQNGYTLIGKDDNIATYSKLNVFDSILEAYNELQILSLQSKLSRSNEINYSQIEKYLHRGIYLDDDAVFIDEMEIPKRIIDLDSPTLVQMFCYIFCEIKDALEENVESPRALTLAHDFKEKYLGQHSSLFDQETFSETLTALKDILNDIEKFTAYKDEDYWHFFEAIYVFLYGENEYNDKEDGKVWGLDNFAFIWEELCYNFALVDEFGSDKILFADRFGRSVISNDFITPFFLQINGQHKRFLRPDLVVVDNNLKELEFLDILEQLFVIENIEIPWYQGVRVNLKLTPRIGNHNFIDLWNIYNRWVDKNPSVRKHPEWLHYRNIAEQNTKEFLTELMSYFYSLSTGQLLNRKPLLFKFAIIDYKYVAEELFTSNFLIPERIHDIKKQLVYEMALQSGYSTNETRSEFWIPTFFNNSDDIYQEVTGLHKDLHNNGIVVLRVNFEYLQQLYLAQ